MFDRLYMTDRCALLLTMALFCAAPSVAAEDINRAAVQTASEMAACRDEGNRSAVLVSVKGIVGEDGNVRVQVYGDDPDAFLAKGKKLLRVDVPTEKDEMDVCVTLPAPGTYAFVAMHDKNANGKADFFTEGFGFSNNPKLILSAPDYEEVAYTVDQGNQEMEIRLTYMFQTKEDKSKKRRRRR